MDLILMKAGLDLDERDHPAVVNALCTKAKPFLQAPGPVTDEASRIFFSLFFCGKRTKVFASFSFLYFV